MGIVVALFPTLTVCKNIRSFYIWRLMSALGVLKGLSGRFAVASAFFFNNGISREK